ncbi:anthranilate synthase component I family protein [Paenibacillus sp. P46E]|uniref:anthranilate synthase component I family protein n=1 Tax=Paenibacillus sp. P46E TaxID=1349436 RepID=UPI00093B00CC|nr:anthranilate synthase component I family protein [Paenibacillus sp. P46E]OKP97599.1 aminobenzoate synthetase [Paenibacillus sp. P46E]
MINEAEVSSLSVDRYAVLEAKPVAKVRRAVLDLRPQPALFETGAGFQPVDGNKTTFMVDLLFELKLLDDTWHACGAGPLSMKTDRCLDIVSNSGKPLWDRLRQVSELLALPEDYPIVLILAYSAARFVEHLPGIKIDSSEPEVVMRVYRYVVEYNGVDEGANLRVLSTPHDQSADAAFLIDTLTNPGDAPSSHEAWGSGVVQDVTNPNAFYASVNRAKDYIRAGDIYQVQLCRQAVTSASIPPVDLYERLASINPAPYMYYLDLGDLHVMSSSPELMIRTREGTAQVRPIAGTMTQDDQRGSQLNHIPKEAAEHLMLVDLARNDLARCSVPGGLHVSSFMQSDAYGPLFHLVSTVETPIRKDCDIWNLIAANFPAGTMTGAPKVRAMEIIGELEDTPRGLYTGCAGYIHGSGDGVLSLTIRTITGNSGNYKLRAAAGIVADSQASAEWDEAGAKIQSFARAFGGGV